MVMTCISIRFERLGFEIYIPRCTYAKIYTVLAVLLFFPTGEDGITPLMWSAVKNQFRIAVFLIKKGADINLRDNPSGYTALMHAINNK